jgi:TRAP-type mannitol/chloroaromatic compound transport system permease small subunit
MKIVEKCINLLGKSISYLIPVMTLLMVIIIVSRYFFGTGRTDLQELVMYIHSLIFLGCAGYVFNQDEHVRVDIFYREASSNTRMG